MYATALAIRSFIYSFIDHRWSMVVMHIHRYHQFSPVFRAARMLMGWALGGDTAMTLKFIKEGFGLATFGEMDTDLGPLIRSALSAKSTYDSFVTSDGHFQLGSLATTTSPTMRPSPAPSRSPSVQPTMVIAYSY